MVVHGGCANGAAEGRHSAAATPPDPTMSNHGIGERSSNHCQVAGEQHFGDLSMALVLRSDAGFSDEVAQRCELAVIAPDLLNGLRWYTLVYCNLFTDLVTHSYTCFT